MNLDTYSYKVRDTVYIIYNIILKRYIPISFSVMKRYRAFLGKRATLPYKYQLNSLIILIPKHILSSSPHNRALSLFSLSLEASAPALPYLEPPVLALPRATTGAPPEHHSCRRATPEPPSTPKPPSLGFVPKTLKIIPFSIIIHSLR